MYLQVTSHSLLTASQHYIVAIDPVRHAKLLVCSSNDEPLKHAQYCKVKDTCMQRKLSRSCMARAKRAWKVHTDALPVLPAPVGAATTMLASVWKAVLNVVLCTGLKYLHGKPALSVEGLLDYGNERAAAALHADEW
jgi:hypothetical protein